MMMMLLMMQMLLLLVYSDASTLFEHILIHTFNGLSYCVKEIWEKKNIADKP